MEYILEDSQYIKSIREVSILTGKDSPNDTLAKYNVGGTDLGIPYYDESRQEMYFLFGDTFSSVNMIGDDWRSQTVAVAKDLSFENGILFERYLTDENGNAKEIISSQKRTSEEDIEVTCIPTGAICIDGVHYVFYMSISKWMPMIGWKINYCGIAKSTDALHFEKLNNLFFLADNLKNTMDILKVSEEEALKRSAPNMAQIFPYEHEGYIYLFGIPGGRKGAVKLARVKKEYFEEQDKYEYYVGEEFKTGYSGLKEFSESETNFITDKFVGELSVCYSKYLNKFVLTYLSGPDYSRVAPGIKMQTSDDLIHWDEGEIIIDYFHYYKLYGAFTHDLLQSEDGKKLCFIMSQWISPKKEDYGYNSKVMEITFK